MNETIDFHIKYFKELYQMAEQKVDPNRTKDDQAVGGTAFQPLATPAVDEKGQPLPLGTETLEAQRAGWKAAEQQVAKSEEENPMQVAGVEADVQNAVQNPTQSGATDVKKEDVVKQGEESKKVLDQQAKDVKAQQDAGVKTAATTTAERTGVGTRSTSSQPFDESPGPAKVEGDPAKLAQEEGKKVAENDPAFRGVKDVAANQPKTADTPSQQETSKQVKKGKK